MPTLLELTLPRYDFREVHRRRMVAPADDVWAALQEVRLDQLRITRPLVALRHLGRSPRTARPLLTDGPVRTFEIGPRYALAGTVGRPWRVRPERREVVDLAGFGAFDEPGWTTYLTDFSLVDVPGAAGRCELRAETRGVSTSTSARRRMAAYWALIRVPSGLVRRDLLASVDRLALARPSTTGPGLTAR